MLDCPRAYSADDQGTEGKSTDVVCYCIEFQLYVCAKMPFHALLKGLFCYNAQFAPLCCILLQ